LGREISLTLRRNAPAGDTEAYLLQAWIGREHLGRRGLRTEAPVSTQIICWK
jgi:hypothetical protein